MADGDRFFRDTLLCVDLSNQVYRAAAANPRLTCGRTFTGGLYGFFVGLGAAVRDTRATRLAICVDSRPYVRSRDYPPYKMLRKSREDPELRERYEESKRLVLEVLMEVGAPIYGHQGFEADDIGGGLAVRYRHRLERVWSYSNDEDLFQLLALENFSILRGGGEVVTRATLMRDRGLTPQQHLLASALAGTHNDVEGIPGIGEKRSARAAKDPSELRALREKWSAVIDRNLDLIRLPHAELPRSAVTLDPPGRAFDRRALYRALGRWDVEATDAMVRAFEDTAV